MLLLLPPFTTRGIDVYNLHMQVNVLETVATIHRVLRKGGIWVNLGPLAYHFAPVGAQ